MRVFFSSADAAPRPVIDIRPGRNWAMRPEQTLPRVTASGNASTTRSAGRRSVPLCE